MSVIGNPVTLGGGKIDCCAVFFGRTTFHQSFQSKGIYGGYQWADGIHFESTSDNDGHSTFRCLKSGTYYFSFYLKGGYNGSGDFKQTTGRLTINGTVFNTVTTNSTSGSKDMWTLPLSVGDVVFWDQKVDWTSTLNVNGAGMITLTQPESK